MQVPQFPECQHLIITALSEKTDQELVSLFQTHPNQGKYFVALFCRYGTDIYTMIRRAVRSPVQGEYLFSMVWKQIHHELQNLDVADLAVSQEFSSQETTDKCVSTPSLERRPSLGGDLRAWLLAITRAYIQQADLPPVESIHYSLAEASPPFLHYLEQSLEHLSPLHRLIVLMAQTFQWRPIRIAAYLRAEGTLLSEADVEQSLAQGYQALTATLPDDICEIYQLQSAQ